MAYDNNDRRGAGGRGKGGGNARKPGYRTPGSRGESGGYGANRGENAGGAGGYRPSGGEQRGYDNRRNSGYRPSDGEQRGYDNRRNSGYRPSDGEQRGYDNRRNSGYRPSEGEQRGYDSRRNNNYRPNDGEQRGYDSRRNNNYRPSDGEQRGYDSRQPADRFAPSHDASEARKARYAEKRRYAEAPAQAESVPAQAAVPPVVQEEPWFLMGRNAVREAVKSGRSIDRILVTSEQDGSLGEIVRMARERNLVVRTVERKKLDEMAMPFGHNNRPGNHQGIIALVPEVEYCSLADILNAAKAKGQAPFVVVLDEILDPYNLGSIIRSACCAGAHGVVISKRRAASVTAAVAKSSAGAVNYMNIAKVTNINAALQTLKDAGLWIAGAVMDGTPMAKVDMTGPLALVIGNEGEGIGKLIQKNCDHMVTIPITGPIDSLNASVAAAILLFEKNRQDAAKR